MAVRVAKTSQCRGWLFTAADLPRLMSVPDERGSYRSPVLQFVWDWNVAPDRGALVCEAPVYGGDDPNLLPAIAVVVHALASRDGEPVPSWGCWVSCSVGCDAVRLRFRYSLRPLGAAAVSRCV